MKNDKRNKLPADWVNEKLRMLRQQLKTTGTWPESAEHLWQDLAHHQIEEDKKGDETMLSIVVSDAVQGIDIVERYPAFYRRMLQNPEIFQAFLDAVEILEADAAGLLDPLPETKTDPPVKLSSHSRPILQWAASGAWLARWRQSVEELNVLFSSFSPLSAPQYRSGSVILEEGPVPLIRSEVTVDEHDFGVLLTAAWADDPDNLQLQLSVALMPDDSAEFRLSSLRAGLHWGAYNQVSAVDDYGRAIFPLLPIAAITDESGQSVTRDLQLLLHPTS